MKSMIKKTTFAIVTLIAAQNAITMEVPATMTELLKDSKVQAFVLEMSKIKAEQAGSITRNFIDSGKGIKDGFHALGLGISRLALYGSQTFRDIGVSLANHYVVLGGLLAGSAWFYMYVLPKIRVSISYSSDHRARA